jgi:isochorismate synthase
VDRLRSVTFDLSEGDAATASLVDIAGEDGFLFVRDGRGFAGWGTADRVDVDSAVERLAAIPHEDRSAGCAGPLAFGALPFSPGASADLVVPAVLIRDNGNGRRTVTVTGTDEVDEPPHIPVHRAPAPTAASFEVAPDGPVDGYLSAVERAAEAVRGGRLAKAVIARPVRIRSDSAIRVHLVLRRLESMFASTYRFSFDGLIGASPELLVEVDELVVRANPLAGTTRTTGDPDRDASLAEALLRSEKNQIEHRAAIEMVRDTLLPHCSYLDWTPEPSIVKVANVQHLGSLAEGRLATPPATVTELVRALQPTPAVGGHPRDVALRLIAELEDFERGRYGGAIGWVDGQGDGTWAVTLRCAELSEDRREARLVAGGGIVADSIADDELAETQAKLQAMLSAIVRP